MKMKFIRKCLITFSLILFISVLMPKTAQAAEDNYRLNLTSIVLAKGTERTLRTYNVPENAKINFKSGDEEIASVNVDGVISANKVGDTVITVTIKEGSTSTSLYCDVTVGLAAVSVKWTQSIVILGIDEVDTLKVITKPYNTVENAKFTSLNSSVVSVTPGGRITAKAYGLAELRAYIDATESDGTQKYDSCAVIVTSKDNVPRLEKYFSDHTELDSIRENDLLDALNKFFNEEFDQTTSSSLISSLDRYLNKVFDLD